MKAQIIFKSGAQVTVDVSRWRNIQNPNGNIDFEWIDKRNGLMLQYIDLAEVAAVVLDKTRTEEGSDERS